MGVVKVQVTWWSGVGPRPCTTSGPHPSEALGEQVPAMVQLPGALVFMVGTSALGALCWV